MTATPALLTEDDLHHWRACVRRQWLRAQQPPADPDASDTADPIAEDDVIHGPAQEQALRASFPGAIRVPAPRDARDRTGWDAALAQTAALWHDARLQHEGAAIFGACLRSDDGVQVRVDVAQRGAHGWRLLRLHWATVGNEADVDAVALWVHVAARAGLRVQHAGLLLVDTDFVYPGLGLYAGLLREVDLGPVLGTRPVPQWLVALHAQPRQPCPPVPLGAPCTQAGGCPFVADCLAQDPAQRPVPPHASLDILGRETAEQLRLEGCHDVHDVPLERLDSPRLHRAALAVQQGRAVLEPGVAALMRALPWPRHALRLDTIGFAVPIWPGTRPYQVLPFQWSCTTDHAPDDADSSASHTGFLADPVQGDPRRAFAESLLQALGTRGAILAYNAGFERNRLRELAIMLPDLAPELEALLPRITDLFQLARAHWYHPQMAGSWSFRRVFGALAPDLPPQALDGSRAVRLYATLLGAGLPAAAVEATRTELQQHARWQTEALRRMAALFAQADQIIEP